MIEMRLDTSKAEAYFAQLAAKVQDTRPAMVAIADIMRDSVEKNFEVGGRPAWDPLSDKRIKQRSSPHMKYRVKHKASWPGRILIEMGTQGGLLGSISNRATNDTAVVGAIGDYAAAQQFGIPEQNLPARPYLVIQEEDVDEAEALLLRHLLR